MKSRSLIILFGLLCVSNTIEANTMRKKYNDRYDQNTVSDDSGFLNNDSTYALASTSQNVGQNTAQNADQNTDQSNKVDYTQNTAPAQNTKNVQVKPTGDQTVKVDYTQNTAPAQNTKNVWVKPTGGQTVNQNTSQTKNLGGSYIDNTTGDNQEARLKNYINDLISKILIEKLGR